MAFIKPPLEFVKRDQTTRVLLQQMNPAFRENSTDAHRVTRDSRAKNLERLELAHHAALGGLSHQHFIVINRIDSKVISQSLWEFGCAPGFSEQAIHVCSRHGAGVIQRKERIKPDLL